MEACPRRKEGGISLSRPLHLLPQAPTGRLCFTTEPRACLSVLLSGRLHPVGSCRAICCEGDGSASSRVCLQTGLCMLEKHRTSSRHCAVPGGKGDQ